MCECAESLEHREGTRWGDVQFKFTEAVILKTAEGVRGGNTNTVVRSKRLKKPRRGAYEADNVHSIALGVGTANISIPSVLITLQPFYLTSHRSRGSRNSNKNG